MDSGTYTVTWQPVPELDIAGYFIYRYVGKETQPVPTDYFVLNRKPHSENVFTDSLGINVSGVIQYAVAAVDTSFNISELSIPARFTIPDIQPPATPFLKAPLVTDESIRLAWMQNIDSDLDSWWLYRISSLDSMAFKVQPDSTGYTDKNVKPGMAYTYYLIAKGLEWKLFFKK